MLVDEIVLGGKSPTWVLKNITPYLLHIVRKENRSSLDILCSKINSDGSGKGAHIIYPVVDSGPIDSRAVNIITSFAEKIGARTTAIYCQYSHDNTDYTPKMPNDIVISSAYFPVLSSISKNERDATILLDSVGYFMTLQFDEKKAEDIIHDIFAKFGMLYASVNPHTHIELSLLFKHVILDYIDYKAVVLTSSGIVSWLESGEMMAIVEGFAGEIMNICMGMLDCPDAYENTIINALVYEKLLYWQLTSLTSIPSDVRSIVGSCVSKHRSYQRRQYQELSTIAYSEFMKVITGEESKFSATLQTTFDMTKGTDAATPKGILHPKNPAPYITPAYITSHLVSYIDDLKPDDISFDIPEERLSMLVHDLGTGALTMDFDGSKTNHYYEDESNGNEYKLFMVKDSARIVYGINTDKHRIDLLRFSDGAPKWDYVFKYQ